LKVGDLAGVAEDWPKAIQNFEKVATASVSNNLMKWSVKDYFLKAGLCHLATTDMVSFNRALDRYRDMDPTFASTRGISTKSNQRRFSVSVANVSKNINSSSISPPRSKEATRKSSLINYSSMTKSASWISGRRLSCLRLKGILRLLERTSLDLRAGIVAMMSGIGKRSLDFAGSGESRLEIDYAWYLQSFNQIMKQASLLTSKQ